MGAGCGSECPVAKGQQLLVQVPPPAHLIKEAPTSIDQDPAKLQPYLMGIMGMCQDDCVGRP